MADSQHPLIELIDSVTEFNQWLKQFDWSVVIVKAGLLFFLVFLLALVVSFLWKAICWSIYRQRGKGEELQRRQGQFLQYLRTPLSKLSSDEIQERGRLLEILIQDLPKKITKKHEGEIQEFHQVAEVLAERKELEKRQRMLEEQERQRWKEREKQYQRQRVFSLFEFMKEKGSSDVFPIDEEYSLEEVKRARELAQAHFEKEQLKKDAEKRAFEFYQIHSLDTKPLLESWEESHYEKIRNGLLDGTVKRKKALKVEYAGERLPKNFYRASELDEISRIHALKQGFEHVRGIKLDGTPVPGGFYVRKVMEKETNYHFYTKHLFAELHPALRVEFDADGKRADVAFISKGLRFAIEVETGTNKMDQLAAKIPWLNKNFSQWIFVCPRKLTKKYTSLVDGKKSFCLTPKRAKEKVLEWVAPIPHR